MTQFPDFKMTMADFYYFFVKTVSKSNYDINNVCFTLTLI